MKNRSLYFIFFLLLTAVILISGQENPIELVKKAEYEMLREDFYQAIKFYRSALNQNPHYLEAQKGLAEAFFLLGEYDEALKQIDKALKLGQQQSSLHILKGRILLGLGRTGEAQIIFNFILSGESNNLQAQYALAESYLMEGYPRQAIELFEKSAQLYQPSLRVFLSLILLYDSLGKHQKSEQLVRKALRYYPKERKLYFFAARHYYLQKEFKRAQDFLYDAIELSPERKYQQASVLLAEIYLAQTEWEKARQAIQEMAQAFGRSARFHFLTALAWAGSGDIDQAYFNFMSALRQAPRNEFYRIYCENYCKSQMKEEDPRRKELAEYHLKLGESYQDQRYLLRARHEYRRALYLDPYSREASLKYARINYIQGYYQKYLDTLKALQDKGLADQDVNDAVEIFNSLYEDSLSAEWGIKSPVTVLQKRKQEGIKILLFDQSAGMDLISLLGSTMLIDYFRFITVPFPEIQIDFAQADDFTSAFRIAREQNCDYFVLFAVDGDEERFKASYALYLSRTGVKISEIEKIYRGNNRIYSCMREIAAQLRNSFPKLGMVLERRFSRVLINIGKIDGLEKDKKLSILKDQALHFTDSKPGIYFNEADVLGEIQIKKLDEFVSEAEIIRRAGIDAIGSGNRVVLLSEAEFKTALQHSPDSEVGKFFLQLR